MQQSPVIENPATDEKRWFVLHFVHKAGRPTPRKHIDDFNREGHDLELFAPIIRPASVVDGKVEYRERLLTYYYVFVKGAFEDVKELCSRPANGLSFLLDRGSAARYAIVSEAAMDNFKVIARAHTNAVPFFSIEDIELSEGDIVEVVDGQYAGLKGTFMPKPRSTKGSLVIAVTAALGAMVWDIDAKHVRILEFARDTRRQYDMVDSFIDKLLPILRKFHARAELTDREKSQLTVFSRRMSAASSANPKAEAKLLAALMCAQHILGDAEGYRASQQRFEKRRQAVTNPWTRALIELILSAALGDTARLKAASRELPAPPEKPTAPQQQLLAEYQYYLSN